VFPFRLVVKPESDPISKFRMLARLGEVRRTAITQPAEGGLCRQKLLDPEVVDASSVCNHFDHPARGFAAA
jgi:hypothetical protein